MAMKQVKFLLMCGCILAALATKGAFGVSASAPLNRVVYEGATNTTITCQNKASFMDWTIIPYTSTGSTSGKTFTRNGKITSSFNELFAVDHLQGTDVHTLVIYNATISPAGKATISTTGFYQCRINSTMTAAQLVVVRNDPICSSNFDQSTASCTIVYGALRQFPIDAVMNWSVNGQPIPSDNAKFTINSTSTEITATSILVVNQNSDATYECATKFSKTANNPYSDVANNAPDYYKTCTVSMKQPTTATTTTSQQAMTSFLSPTTTKTAATRGSFIGLSSPLALLNRVVYEGATNTTMSCKSEGGYMDWIIFPSNYSKSFESNRNSMNKIVHAGEIQFPFNGSFANDQLQGTNVYNLVIFNATISPSERATFSTAGIYQCFNPDTRTPVARQLVVIRSDPICSSDLSQSTASCTIVYGGNRAMPIDAVMNWSVNGEPIPSGFSSFTINSSPTEVTATSILAVNSDSDATFECATTFGQPSNNADSKVANNAPDYYKTCTISKYRCEPNLKNMAVYEGQLDIMMRLTSDPQSVTWNVAPTSDELNLQNIINIGGTKNPLLSDLFDVTETGLAIKKATVTGDPISTAGLYIGKCADSTDNVGAKLLVIRTGPQCSRTSIDSGSPGVSCNITFADGTLHPIHPIVTWSRNGEFLASNTLEMERIDDLFHAESTIATNGEAHDNYQCEVTFDVPVDIRYEWIATNAPEFKESCSITT